MAKIHAAWLVLAVAGAAGALALGSGGGAGRAAAQATGASDGGTNPAESNCCGQQMTLDTMVGLGIYTVPEDKAADGTVVPERLRTEVYGKNFTATTNLPAGTYTVEVEASENSFAQAGKRVFSIEAVSGGVAQAGPSRRTEVGKNVDLYKLAGGEGKLVSIRAKVEHPGGPLRIMFNGEVDTAKFSVIQILDEKGNKAAWLYAPDVMNLFRLQDTPPVVPGPMVYKDAAQPMELRAADLVKRMTLREKVSQMAYAAPAIWRLDVPAYNYWSEALHGVARNGYATVFPQAIGMSATFDPAALRTVGNAIATEARAKWAEYQAGPGDSFNRSYRGLTFWSPNINLFRDPRWGRGQETYGEDPYLTGTMGVAFIKGLQGDDPKYLKVVATAKHFAVHSGPEPLRHTFDAEPSQRDFYESYLPHFEMAVREGHVSSVMGAYNRVYGSPACESDLLLKNLLRRQWGFQGYVVSDCWAITDIWKNHKVETDPAAAAAGAVLAGCDLECGSDYGALAEAVNAKMIGEGVLDQAVLTRVMLSRFKLGLFDPPAMVKYNQIKADEYCTPGNNQLALKMARESMVLLKNDGVLPLDKSKVKKIAVVGPNADGLLPLLGNYNGTPLEAVPVLKGIKDGFGGTVEVVRGCDNAERKLGWQVVPDVCLRPAANADETGLKAEYFKSSDLSGAADVVRTDKAVDVDGAVEYTLADVPQVGSTRWTGVFVAPADGEYKLTATGSSMFRLIVGGMMVTDQWPPKLGTARSAQLPPLPAFDGPGEMVMRLKKGQQVPVDLECAQSTGVLRLQLMWNRGDLQPLTAQMTADRVKDADVIVYVGGMDGHMEAEEGDSRGDFQGFNDGDRTAIELPASQDRLLRALAATGKPVVMVNMGGSAVAMPWEAEHVNAIVQAWYPGQAGGTAVADVLFGRYNPSGRLPVTFYRATADLPDFTNYAMGAVGGGKGRTYRYFAGEPLWAFGHGLSYTSFKYSAVKVDKAQAAAGDTVTVSVDVTNAGARDGDEVVQIYARQDKPGAGDAQERLVGFVRVNVAAGKTAHVSVPVAMERLRNWDEARGVYFVPAGGWKLFAGASSADLRGFAELEVK